MRRVFTRPVHTDVAGWVDKVAPANAEAANIVPRLFRGATIRKAEDDVMLPSITKIWTGRRERDGEWKRCYMMRGPAIYLYKRLAKTHRTP